MYCPKCGFQNVNGELYCKNCGNILEENQNINQQINNIQQNQTENVSNKQYSKNIENTIYPNMKKWAIFSIILPIIVILVFLFYKISFFLIILSCSLGFSFAKKGAISDKKLAKIGYILNGVVSIIAIIIFIILLAGSLLNHS